MREIRFQQGGVIHSFRQHDFGGEGLWSWYRLLPSGEQAPTGLWYLEGETEDQVRRQLTRWLERQKGTEP